MKSVSYIQPQVIAPGELEIPDAWAFEAAALDRAIREAMAADARITRRKPNYARAFEFVKAQKPELVKNYLKAARTRRRKK